MLFRVSTSSVASPELTLPQVILVPTSWDDWFEFSTLYSVVYIDEERIRHNLGTIKIGEFGMVNQRRPNLQDQFTGIGENFFSLGQDVTYYEEVKKLGDAKREELHKGLNDIAFNAEIYESALKEKVTKISLLRSVSPTSVEGQFRRLAEGRATLSEYHFTYTTPVIRRGIPPVTLTFSVRPRSHPPSNVHVIIGRNGVGKTHLLNNMVSSLIEQDSGNKFGHFAASERRSSDQIFANLVSVTFSAFDESDPKPERRDKTAGIQYSYIGLKRHKTKDRNIMPPKSPTTLKNEFAKSAYACKVGGKSRRWVIALTELEADPIFQSADIASILDFDDEDEFKVEAGKLFNKLSSGHKIVLLTITRLVETLEERSLVLLDEPEAHLHPPLLSALLRALSNLLMARNAVAIIATHSPVVLQEVPKNCCWKLRRNGANVIAERLTVESFGENVGSLTQEVFGLEVTSSGFHRLLSSAVETRTNYDDVISFFDNSLGFEAKALVQSLIASKQNQQE